MSYIGSNPTTGTTNPGVDYFSGNGSTTSFTLSRSVASTYQILAIVANVIQNPSLAFTVNNNILTFTSAPPSGTNNIWIYYNSWNTQLQGVVPLASVSTTDINVNGLTVGRGNNSAVTNTAVGASSLSAISSGYQNVAVGYNSGLSITSGINNVSIGYKSMFAGTGVTGGQNVGVGNYTLYTNQNGTYNTAIGEEVLQSNTSGSNNVGVGPNTLNSLISGNNNIALGYQASYLNQIKGNTVGIGYQALYSNTGSGYAVGIGYQAGYGFQGTLDNYGSVFLGFYAGTALTTGYDNTFLGGYAGRNNTSGFFNVSVGPGALLTNTTSTNNTTVGYLAGTNVNGVYGGNTLIGGGAGTGITTGYDNTIVGRSSMQATASGWGNTGVGARTLAALTTGNGNTAIGGYWDGNTYSALFNLTTGNGNSAVGVYALGGVTTGSYNIGIGYGTNPSAATDSNEIIIGAANGAGVTGKGPNTAFITANGGSSYNGANTTVWVVASDQRLKKNIVDNTVGLEKIKQIRVRNFEYRLPEEITELSTSSAITITGTQLGVIAQEIQVILPDCVIEESTGVLALDTDNIKWHMVNAIKQLNDLVEQQAATIASQARDIATLKAKVGI
jgi:hypothetical protein